MGHWDFLLLVMLLVGDRVTGIFLLLVTS